VAGRVLAVQAAYLARLELDAEPPSVAALFRLHRAHVERVPYETLWIHLGEAWGIEADDSVERVANHQRGGYCFHLNGAFSELLKSLGYSVVRHVGGVHGPAGPSEADLTNHLVLTVGGLPTDENPGGDWYVDAGLGDALHEPLPLLAGAYHQPPFRVALERTAGGVGDWHLTHDPEGGFVGMSWRSTPADIGAFADRHEWLSTSPDSGFVKFLTVQRRDATGVDILRGLVLSRTGSGAFETTLTDKRELIEVLADVFALGLTRADDRALDRLWITTLETHRAWDAAGRP
jgi:N-hydroxyarylamine O-acetyltransferase